MRLQDQKQKWYFCLEKEVNAGNDILILAPAASSQEPGWNQKTAK